MAPAFVGADAGAMLYPPPDAPPRLAIPLPKFELNLTRRAGDTGRSFGRALERLGYGPADALLRY